MNCNLGNNLINDNFVFINIDGKTSNFNYF